VGLLAVDERTCYGPGDEGRNADDVRMAAPPFLDRRDAGDALAEALRGVIQPPAAVLGIPRGGVVVAARVASRLGLPLGVVVTKKLGAPGNPELGIGAVAPGVRVLEQDVLTALSVSDRWLARESARVDAEVARRADAYGAVIDVHGSTAAVVDDGVATGSTARAAGIWARQAGATHVVLGVPVAPVGVERRVADAFDDVVAVLTPSDLRAVGQYYADFGQVGDDEVRDLLKTAG
jgi:putative phosphoribosyl transferase